MKNESIKNRINEHEDVINAIDLVLAYMEDFDEPIIADGVTKESFIFYLGGVKWFTKDHLNSLKNMQKNN